jgi:hypothetical protein
MPRCLIIAQSSQTAAALNSWREAAGYPGVFGPDSCPDPILCDPVAMSSTDGAQVYAALAAQIDASAKEGDADVIEDGVVALVDQVRPQKMSVVTEGSSWDQAIASLVLTFPQIEWLFGDGLGGCEGFPAAAHGLSALILHPRRDPIFDPTGLRDWIRRRTNDALKHQAGDQALFRLPVRDLLAASIDEEQDYAYYHGYAAYRHGFRVDVVTSWALMETLFGGKSDKTCHGYSLLLEDMRLAFPDKPMSVHLSRLAERGVMCPLLAWDKDTSRWRFMITSGQESLDGSVLVANKEYLRRRKHGRGDVLNKPIGGLLDLWQELELPRDALNFDWPPQCIEVDDAGLGHGTPGKLMLIADRLLRSARLLCASGNSPRDFVRGALYAVEGTELLAGRTATMALGGTILKHKLEARAECAFPGAGRRIGIHRRVKELKDETAAVAKWFCRSARRRAGLGAEVSALAELAAIYSEDGQLEEELVCLVALRRGNRKLSRPSGLARWDPLSWVSHLALWYAEFLLSSFTQIWLMTMLWLVVLTGAALWLTPEYANHERAAATAAIYWFIALSPELQGGPLVTVLSWCGVACGLFHIGVLISYLYSLVSRE